MTSGNAGAARPPLHLVKDSLYRQVAARSESPAPPATPAEHSPTAENLDALWDDFLAMPARFK